MQGLRGGRAYRPCSAKLRGRQRLRGDEPGSRKALDTLDPKPYFLKHGENTWLAMRDYLDAAAAAASAPVIEK
jgi:hypothetical protein